MADWPLSGAFLRVTAANFFFFLNFASFFLLPLHLHELGADRATVGAVMGTNGLAALVFLPVVGMTIDRFGRRRFLLGGAAGMALAAVAFPAIDTIGVEIFLLRVLQGISFAAAFTATTTYAAALAPPAMRARALGIFGLSTLLTHAIAPGLGEEIVRRAGFDALFYVAGGCTVVVAAVALGLPRDAPVVSVAVRAPRRRRLTRAHWVLAATTVLSGMGFGTVMTFVAAYVHHEQLGRVGLFFAAYTTAAIAVRIGGAGLSDRLGRRRVILPAQAVLSAAILWLSMAGGTWSLVCAGSLFGAAQGISYPTLHAYAVDLSDGMNLGRAQALFNGGFNLGVTGSAFVFGLIAEMFGYRPMLAMAAAMPLLGSVLLYSMARADPRPV